MGVRVQSQAFDAGGELNKFTQECAGAGAIVSFTGVVRDVDGGLRHMEIEHYPAMTKKALEVIAAEAGTRWNLAGSLVIHRYGILTVGAPIMMVATAASHRADAFAAAAFLMDYLKSRAPFWKKEVRVDGAQWVAAKDADEAALKRW